MQNEVIRTLGLYQPFATLMLHGKIETRWVQSGKKPPFPLGKYLIYATKESASYSEVYRVSGQYFSRLNWAIIDNDNPDNVLYGGMAMAVGNLISIVPYMSLDDKASTFVDSLDGWMEVVKGGKSTYYTLWALVFENVKRIKPFQLKGKQGIGFLSDADKDKIKFV